MINLFVYGTLKEGHRLHTYLNRGKFVGLGRLDNFTLYTNGSYPMCVKSKKNEYVLGEVYQFGFWEWLLSFPIIDMIEGSYKRETHNVTLLNGGNSKVEVYVWEHTTRGLKHIGSSFEGV